MAATLTPAELTAFVDAVQRRRTAGQTMWAIAGALGCTTDMLKRRLRLAGVDPHPRPARPAVEFTAEQTADIQARYQAGATLCGIGSALGYSDKIIRRVLCNAGVTIRPRPFQPGHDPRRRINR